MTRPIRAFLMVLSFLAGAAVCSAGGKAGEKGIVTFHLETAGAGNPKMVFDMKDGDKVRYYHRSPSISMKDITGFAPFPSGEGNMFGAVFKLNKTATGRLNALSNANIGKYLVAQANGRIVDGVLIDKPVDDGFVVIWKGLSQEDIKLFDNALPRVNEDKDAKKKKKKKK